MSSDHPWLDRLRDSSAALQGVLGALLEAERHFSPPASPHERLRQITTSPEWVWLQPLYRLIADVDHALAYAEDLPASESAAIGAHARELLAGGGAPAEQPFLEHYRALLQTDPAVAMAHAAALRALQALPAEATNQSERLHARHQWNERRRFLRMGQRGRGTSCALVRAARAAQPDLQLVPVVIDDQHVEGSEQIHSERQGGLIGELPVLEQIHVAEGDAHAANGEEPKVD